MAEAALHARVRPETPARGLQPTTSAAPALREALETPGGLRIETIHAFSGRVLRRFPLEAGIAPGFSELDDDDAAEIWDASFRAMGRRVVRGDQAARYAAEAAAAGREAVRSLPRVRRHRAISPGWRDGHAVERLAREIGAPSLSADELLEKAMGADLPRKALEDLLGALPTAKKSDAELASTLATVLAAAPAADRFAAYAALAFTKSGDERKSNPYTAEALKAAPAIALFFQIKEIPQGSEIHRIHVAKP
jgi:ATP-dependent helicase/nuclease subunit A